MRTFTIAGALLLAAGPAFAQTETPPPGAGTPAAPPAHTAPAAHARPAPLTLEAQVNQRIALMHARLKITPEQQPAWDAFAQSMRDNTTAIEQAYKDRRASVATMSAPDNMKDFAQIEQRRADGIQKMAASFQTLYDGMSDQQKQLADTMFRHYADRPGAPGRAAAK
jgi:protein CpxP